MDTKEAASSALGIRLGLLFLSLDESGRYVFTGKCSCVECRFNGWIGMEVYVRRGSEDLWLLGGEEKGFWDQCEGRWGRVKYACKHL